MLSNLAISLSNVFVACTASVDLEENRGIRIIHVKQLFEYKYFMFICLETPLPWTAVLLRNKNVYNWFCINN